MLILSNEDIEQVLPMRQCIAILEEGFRDLGMGQAVDTGRTDVYTGTPQPGLFHRTSILRGANRRLQATSVRIMSDMVTWPEEGGIKTEEKYCVRPNIFCGLVVLFSTENGEPLALFNDGYIQHLTVGAGAGIGARYLARADAATLGVIGSGGQARTFTEAVCAVRPIRHVKVYSPTPEHREEFARLAEKKYEVECQVLDNPRDVCAGADILVTATDSVRPVFQASLVEAGSHYTYVNEDEVDPAVFERADVIASLYSASGRALNPAPLRLAHGFPSWAVADEVELSIVPARGPSPGHPGKTVALIDVLLGRTQGRHNEAEITLCPGGGNQRFTAVGYAAYLLAREGGLGNEVPTDWFLQTIRD